MYKKLCPLVLLDLLSITTYALRLGKKISNLQYLYTEVYLYTQILTKKIFYECNWIVSAVSSRIFRFSIAFESLRNLSAGFLSSKFFINSSFPA